jgi:hypothetical protein
MELAKVKQTELMRLKPELMKHECALSSFLHALHPLFYHFPSLIPLLLSLSHSLSLRAPFLFPGPTLTSCSPTSTLQTACASGRPPRSPSLFCPGRSRRSSSSR